MTIEMSLIMTIIIIIITMNSMTTIIIMTIEMSMIIMSVEIGLRREHASKQGKRNRKVRFVSNKQCCMVAVN